MKRTLIASAIGITLGTVSVVEAGTAGLTGVWQGTYVFSGFTVGGGTLGPPPTPPQPWRFDFNVGTLSITNSEEIFGTIWTVNEVILTDNNDGTYSGLLIWNTFYDNPILYDMTWDISNNGTVTTVSSIQHECCRAPSIVSFDGTIGQVPIPPAIWLFGSGLLGLIKIARRKNAT